MTARDTLALVISYLYAGGLLALAEALQRWRGVSQSTTRKIVHIGAGMWIFGVLGLFETWYIGVVPFATFIVINFVSYRLKLFRSVDAQDSSPGTIYFACAITLLFGAFWRRDSPSDLAAIAAAGVMAMTWGDSMAAIIGKRFGQRHYTILGTTRTWEGSAACFVVTAIAVAVVLAALPGSPLSPLGQPFALQTIAVATLVGASVAALAEAVSPAGSDNLSVPLLSGVAIYFTTLLGG